jgi:hypothetical protein
MHIEEFPAPSVAVIVTGCGPSPNIVPAAGDCVSVTPLQLSLADVLAVKSGVAAMQPAPACMNCAGAQLVMVGGVVSLTVNVVPHVEKFPDASVTVTVTGCGPMPTSVPAVGTCVMVTLLHVSLATVVAVKFGTGA